MDRNNRLTNLKSQTTPTAPTSTHEQANPANIMSDSLIALIVFS